MAKKSDQVAANRKARFEYDILDRFEAGLVLTGSEVKSVREHKVSLSDSYARLQSGELYLINLDIAPYERAGYAQHEPRRPRKLLLHRKQLRRIAVKLEQRGLTMVPLAMYFSDSGWAKVTLGLARGRQLHDKRRVIREREEKRDMARESRAFR